MTDSATEEVLTDPLVGVKALTGVYLGMNRPSCGRKRIKGRKGASNVFHVMSRTCGGEVFLDETEKEALLIVMRKMARFCGIKILTYCLMGNHFHALVRVPHKPSWLEERFGKPGGAGVEEKLLAHMRLLYSKAHVAAVREDWAQLKRQGGGEGVSSLVAERVRALQSRFCDVSAWMQEVKVRFSRWYNRRHGRQGTLWMGPFKSVLVEAKSEGRRAKGEEPDIARVMAAYIDLNPVRAGLVEGAEDYRWSGWRAALDGDKEAIAGLCDVLHCAPREWAKWGKDSYRRLVAERRSDIARVTKGARELDAGERRTLLVKIPEFSRSLVIGDARSGSGDVGESESRPDSGRRRRRRVGFVQGLTVEMVAGSTPLPVDRATV